MPLVGKRNEGQDLADGIAEKEHEYQMLNQALRFAQSDRAKYIEEMYQTIFKLKTYIEELEVEKKELLVNLKIADSKSNKMKDERNCEDLANLGDNKEWLLEQLEEEKTIQSDLDGKIRDVEIKLKKLQKSSGGSFTHNEVAQNTSKKMKALHGRLSHALAYYNEALGANTKLREEIDTLRMERARFDVMYKKLDQTLTRLRVEINNTVELSTQAYEKREEAHAKMLQITEKCDKDLIQHNLEMKELVRIIDHDRKLQNFMSSKSMERQEDPQLTAWKAKRAKEMEEKSLEVIKSIETYEKAFNQMLELSGEKDIDKLIDTFLKKEDRNFALFNYIAELNMELDVMTEQVGQLQHEIDKLEKSSNKLYHSHKSRIYECDARRKELVDIIEINKLNLKSCNECIIEVVFKVKKLFQKIFSDTSTEKARLNKLLGPKGPQPHNVLTYLATIENRLNELLTLRNFISNNDAETAFDARSILVGNDLGEPVANPTIKLPLVSDEYDDESDITQHVHPYSRSELHIRVMGAVHRKEREAKSIIRDYISESTFKPSSAMGKKISMSVKMN